MSEYKAGQEVRVTIRGILERSEHYPTNGLQIVGRKGHKIGFLDGFGETYEYVDAGDVEILAQPKPAEPTGLGAVVRAVATSAPKADAWLWTRAPYYLSDGKPWTSAHMDPRSWDGLTDVEILSEGYAGE